MIAEWKMDELALHILDLVMNAIEGGASHIRVRIEESVIQDRLAIAVADNGRGMDALYLESVLGDFSTSKSCHAKPVGLGIALIKQTTDAAGGTFSVHSKVGKGTLVKASFQKSNVDMPPLGDVESTLLVMVIGNPHVRFGFSIKSDQETYHLDTRSHQLLTINMRREPL